MEFSEPKFKINNIVLEEKFTKKLGNHVRAVMGGGSTVKINCENNFALMRFRTNESYGKDIEDYFYDNFVTELTVIGSLNLNSFYNWGTRSLEVTSQVFIEDYRIVGD